MVDLNTLQTMDYPFECPYCFKTLNKTNIIDTTEYNVIKHGHCIGGKAVVFECDRCFEKSFIHETSLGYKIW